MKLKLDKFH